MSGAWLSRSHGAFGSSSSLTTPSPDATATTYSTVLTLQLGGLGVGSPGGSVGGGVGGSSSVVSPASSSVASTVVASSGASTPASVRGAGRQDRTSLAEFVFRLAAPPSAAVALSGNWNDWEPLPMAVMDDAMGLASPPTLASPGLSSTAPSPAASVVNLTAAGAAAAAAASSPRLGAADAAADAAGVPAAAAAAAAAAADPPPLFWAVVTRVPVGYVEFVFTVDGQVVVSPQHPVTHDGGANFRYIRGPSPGASAHRHRRSSSVKGRARTAAAVVVAAVSGGGGGDVGARCGGVGSGGGGGGGGGGSGVEGGRGGMGAPDRSSPLASLVAVKTALTGWLADSPAADRDRDRGTCSNGGAVPGGGGGGSVGGGGAGGKASPSWPLLPYGVGDIKDGLDAGGAAGGGGGGGGTLESLATVSRAKLLASAAAAYGVCHLVGRGLAAAAAPRSAPLFV